MNAPADTATRTEVIAAEPVESLAAVLDVDVPAGEVPLGWHQLYLLDRRRHGDLGPDGHPASGIPAPPGAGMRRMFAGGRITTRHRLRVGAPAHRVTRVVSTVAKEGRTGRLTFVTVRLEITQEERLAVVEEQDIVYREASSGGSPPAATDARDARDPLPPDAADGAAPPQREARLDLVVDEALLFRFSALTYNAHRIHYDHTWTAREGYAGLVVHGPLQALLMADLARRHGHDMLGRQFAYRLVSPMIGAQTLTVLAAAQGLASGAEVRSATGVVTARSEFGPPA